jgi:two-component system sensor histidine kinase NreB
VEVSLHAPEPERRCAEPVEVALFRVGQEAMSNIARHARASHAWVSLERSGAWTTLTVRDDGVGFDVGQAMGEDGLSEVHGLGIAGMKERIDLLGGTLEVASRPGDGTSVTARVRTDGADEDGT